MKIKPSKIITLLFVVSLMQSLIAQPVCCFSVWFASATNNSTVILQPATNKMFDLQTRWIQIMGPGLDYLTVEPKVADARMRSGEDYTISGKLVSFNTGAGVEGTSISICSTSEIPELAAITDAKGKFNFSVRIGNKTNYIHQGFGNSLYLTNIQTGAVFVGGNFDSNRKLVSGLVLKYVLSEITNSPSHLPKSNSSLRPTLPQNPRSP